MVAKFSFPFFYKKFFCFIEIGTNTDCVCVCVCSHSVMPNSLQPRGTVACQVPLSMRFPQARMLEWVAISFSTNTDQESIETQEMLV